MANKLLVTYFSITGNTRTVAQKLAKAAGADINEIQPSIPYIGFDLNAEDEKSRVNVEHAVDARPQMAKVINVGDYDAVFVGYPIWFGVAPQIVRTFLESQDFSGKTIVPFATSGGSLEGANGQHLHGCAPKATWKTGRRFMADDSEETLARWVKELSL
ncbi:flavodoxin [Bifidobacterium sp. ESL0745]|uniref:flavodoxin n=1 Tax=Bifidobacterium sp. ESL0745 TaxID=2983226 RepID=UPI0023F922BC|nr:flavodoxin [Bifidobacterium sp. ESL0745]MDF7666225.1 flavodoxin [Bifidobacterium sp. ESL0745]